MSDEYVFTFLHIDMLERCRQVEREGIGDIIYSTVERTMQVTSNQEHFNF